MTKIRIFISSIPQKHAYNSFIHYNKPEGTYLMVIDAVFLRETTYYSLTNLLTPFLVYGRSSIKG